MFQYKTYIHFTFRENNQELNRMKEVVTYEGYDINTAYKPDPNMKEKIILQRQQLFLQVKIYKYST